MEAKMTVVVGLNASGKTMLAERMRRSPQGGSVRYVAFCDSYGTATDRSYYLQQRWNQHDIDAETPTVGQALERSFLLSGSDTPQRRRRQQQLCDLMGMQPLLGQHVIALSSGELRKMQLVKTLMAQPGTIILDNPYIGLDAQARTMLSQQLLRLKEQGMAIVLLVARVGEIPPFADEVRWVTDEMLMRRSEAHALQQQADGAAQAPVADSHAGAPPVVEMHHVSIAYGGRTILAPLSWTIRQGDRWALSGPNGSGKSTLLSLICADNPQAYACDIALFGHPRGSGETIWDIKRRIGYVSPEMHRSYQRSMPALSIVASGLKDTVGLYCRPTQAERSRCLEWMQRFGVAGLAGRSFMQLSSGEQRLLLLCRAFVKEPDLLILDEPMHGLDLQRQMLARQIVDRYCRDRSKTLIMVTHYEHELPACIDHHLRLG